MAAQHTSCEARLRVAIVVPAKKFLCLGGLLWSQRYGPLQVASVARDAGHFVRVFNEELGVRISAEDLGRHFDVVGFSAKTSALTRAEELARDIKNESRRLGRDVITVLGGEHVSMGGDRRISADFDYLLRGEAEEAFALLLEALKNAKADLALPASFHGFQRCPSFDNIPDLSLVVGHANIMRSFLFRHLRLLWMLKHKKVPMLNFQGSRGCPYKCSFCPTPTFLQGSRYRRRTPESAAVYLKEHIAETGIRSIFFEDPTAALPFDDGSHAFFHALAKDPPGMKATALVRADLYRDDALLRLMRSAGITNLSIGIESLSDRARHDFNKKTSSETIKRAIGTFHRIGFTVTGLFIVGYDTDDLNSFDLISEFIGETGIEKWKVSPLTQMPELEGQFLPAHRCFLWDEFAAFGRDVADYGNGEFVLFFPRHMKPSVLQRKIIEFNKQVTSSWNIISLMSRKRSFSSIAERLANNLAQRMVQKEILNSGYLAIVQEIEDQFYRLEGDNAELQERVLVERFRIRSLPKSTSLDERTFNSRLPQPLTHASDGPNDG